jgi:phospholipase C
MIRMLFALSLVACLSACKPPRTETLVREQRLACTFKSGARVKDTVQDGVRLGDRIPIENIVIVMQENRSFDHYFSGLTHGGVITAGTDGRKHIENTCTPDIPHSWNAVHKQWNEGAVDGFITAASGDENAVSYYDERDLPFYYALAREFAISDMHFSSLLGPTFPNRLFFFAGTSFGLIKNNLPPTHDELGRRSKNMFEELVDAGIDFRVYASDVPSSAMFLHTYTDYMDKMLPIERYFTDVAAGTLPAVSVVEPRYTFGRNDEHAPSNIQLGQQFTASVVKTLMNSKHWPHAALFITYDEHGGFSDHVPPPAACRPDDFEPQLDAGSMPGHFDRFGFRVPFIVVSPYAKRGHVSHHMTDGTSVLRFIEARYDLPALTARDANAEPLFDLFDFEHPDTRVPDLPEATVDEAKNEACVRDFPDGR